MLLVPMHEAQLNEQNLQAPSDEKVPTGHEARHSLLKRDPQQAEQLVHWLGCSLQVRHGALQGRHLVLSALATAPGGHEVGQNPLNSNLPALQI